MTELERIKKSCDIIENTEDFDECCDLMLNNISEYINNCLCTFSKGEIPFICFCLKNVYNSCIKQLKQDPTSYFFFKMLCERVSVEETTFVLPTHLLIKGDEPNEL